MLASERYQRHLHDPVLCQRVHGEAHAIHREGTMQHRRLRDFGRDANVHEHRVIDFGDPLHRAHAVDMALHEMPTEPVAGSQRTLQIDGSTLLPLADQGPAERRLHRVNGKGSLHNLLDGQAGAVDSDALALLHAFVGCLYTQFHAVVQAHRVYPADRVYDSGKHSRRSKTNNVSEPSGRRSTTTQRGASASGDAGIPAKAATAPSPSQTGDCTQYKRSTSPSARSLAPSAPPPSHNNDWIPASRSCANACARVSGRKTRTPFPSSTDTFDIGASGDAITQVGTSRAV